MLDKYEWFWPQYIPLTDKSWSDIWSHRSEYHWKDYIFNNDKDNNNDIDILRCELHLFENIFSKTALSCSRFFFKGNLAGASSFSNFWKQGHTTTPGEAFPPFCEKCEDSLRSLLTSTEKMQEMGPAVYRSVPRRLKLLTVWVFTAHSPQSFQDHERWSGPRPEPSTSRTAVQRPTT